MNYKRDYSKCKIQFCYESLACGYRYIYWRIHPNEMTWWDRTFKNPWRQFMHECNAELNPCYTPEMYKNHLSYIKTYEDVLEYYNQQKSIADNRYQRYVDMGLKWPKQLNN